MIIIIRRYGINITPIRAQYSPHVPNSGPVSGSREQHVGSTWRGGVDYKMFIDGAGPGLFRWITLRRSIDSDSCDVSITITDNRPSLSSYLRYLGYFISVSY